MIGRTCPIVGNSVKHLCEMQEIASEKKCPLRESNHGPLGRNFTVLFVLIVKLFNRANGKEKKRLAGVSIFFFVGKT